MKNLPIISGWEPEQLRAEATALRNRATWVDRGHWCQGVSARDSDGDEVDPLEPTAACYCAGCHIDYFTPFPILGIELMEQSTLTERTKRMGRWNIPLWNDTRRKPYQVARAFRAAAARGERYASMLEAEHAVG